jgi:MoxR-like ATPase
MLMADLVLVLVSGEVMEHNLARSLAEPAHQPWAFKDWKRQMQAVTPGRSIVFVDMQDEQGRQVTRFTKGTATLSCRRAVLGTLESKVERVTDPFFAGYPFGFSYRFEDDHTFEPPTPIDDLADWLNEAVPDLDVAPLQLRELITHAKSNKIGVYIDGAPRKAGHFADNGVPRPRAPMSGSTTHVADPAPDELVKPTATNPRLSAAIDAFATAVEQAGLVFLGPNENLPRAFLAALVTKRFAILSGLSGSGKTQLARALGQWLRAADNDSDRYVVVPVRPDWTSPEPLLGYEDALLPMKDGRRAWTAPQPLQFMLRAANDPQNLYLLILDEMNLAHVERYFADVLSGVESGEAILPDLELVDGHWRAKDNGFSLTFPPNLMVVGTVNVDETTYQFSPKVLDRAFSFDFRVTTDELGAAAAPLQRITRADSRHLDALRDAVADPDWHLTAPAAQADEVRDHLIDLHRRLSEIGFEFGHRTFLEASRFVAALAQAGVADTDEAVDWIVMTKILPRLHGSRRQLEGFMTDLLASATGSDADKPTMPRTSRKVRRMLDLMTANQFVSFAE